MFTGIIEELGTIKKISKQGNTMVLSIAAKQVTEDLKLGDSISVNGVCLTATDFSKDYFLVDVMPETFKSTSLSSLKEGALVNLERAMSSNGRFGGHFVTGHVDGIGQIIKKTPKENAIYVDITLPKEYSHLTILKGSVAIDGTSLTIFGLTDRQLTVSIIPHTAKETVLGFKKTGDIVNLEFDMIAKYLHSFISKDQNESNGSTGISKEFLKENGYL